MKMNHIGYAVKNIEKAEEKFKELGFQRSLKTRGGTREIQLDYERNIKILFLDNGIDDVMIELIELLDPEKPSPLDFIINGKAGNYSNGIPYHICYEVEDIDQATEELRRKHFTIINPKQATTEVLDHKCVTFLFNRTIGIIELIEK